MGTRTIWLARHGETAWNREGRWQGKTDIALSEVGLAQAAELAGRLRAFRDEALGEGAGTNAATVTSEAEASPGLASFADLVQVHSSDLSRARQTADVVASVLGLPPPRVHAGLRERGFGCFEGLTRVECEARFPEAWQRYLADRRSTPPGAEPHADVTVRVQAAMLDVARATPAGAAALVISHGGTLRTFIHAVTGVAPPPVANAALFRAVFDGTTFTTVDPIGEVAEPPKTF